MGPQPAVGPTLWGHRDLREQTGNMKREQTKDGKYTNPIKPVAKNHDAGDTSYSQYSVPQGLGVETEVPHDRVTNRSQAIKDPRTTTC